VKIQKSQFLTFIVIATGKTYLEMALVLIRTIRKEFPADCEIVLFTDQVNERIDQREVNSWVIVESLKWPEASALRFEIMNNNKKEFSGDVLIYLDADTIVRTNFDLNQILPNQQGMFFVEHPGYFKRGFIRYIYKRLLNSSWETDRQSWSRVPISKRRKYIYGAIFGGEKESFLKMIKILASETKKDIERGFYPRSYDESYLNSWYARYGGNLLSPKYAWTPKFPWLSEIRDPVFEIYEKNEEIEDLKKRLDKN
jgi:hypothetical protein